MGAVDGLGLEGPMATPHGRRVGEDYRRLSAIPPSHGFIFNISQSLRTHIQICSRNDRKTMAGLYGDLSLADRRPMGVALVFPSPQSSTAPSFVKLLTVINVKERAGKIERFVIPTKQCPGFAGTTASTTTPPGILHPISSLQPANLVMAYISANLLSGGKLGE